MNRLVRTGALGVGVLALLTLAAAKRAGPVRPAAPVKQEQVVAAMAKQGIPIAARQVSFLAPVVSMTSAAELSVQSLEALGETAATVRLRCHASRECLPFLVIVKWPTPEAAKTGLATWNAHRQPLRAQLPATEALVVRRGQAVVLVIEGRSMRIEMPVICLQDGSLGSNITVASKDPKRTYLAEVVSARLVKSRIRDDHE